MSIQNESIDLHKSAEEAPSLEYRTVGHDSLSIFLSALGGAILGVLLTLLILAIINGGTLTFGGDARLAELEMTLTRVDENLGTVSANVDTLASELVAVRDGLATAQGQLANFVANQQSQADDVVAQIEGVNEAIITLDETSQRFDRFLDAMTEALLETEPTLPPFVPEAEPLLP